MMGIKIIATGSYLPSKVVTNDDLSKIVDTSDEWIVKRTGIRTRHYLGEGETHQTMAEAAAKQALERANIDRSKIAACIVTTLGGDYITPTCACMLQAALELEENTACFDMNSACAGFPYGLKLAQGLVTKERPYALVVSCEALSRLTDFTDRSTCVLFGDGAGAVVLEQGDSLQAIKLTTKGNADYLRIANSFGNCPIDERYLTEKNPEADVVSEFSQEIDYKEDGTPYEYLKMDGQGTYKFAISSMCREIPLTLEMAGITMEDVDYFLPHQANLRIIDGARTRLKIPKEKTRTNLQHCGNTSSASIPLLLDEMNRKGELHRDDILLLSAFGAGLTTATCVLKWAK